MVKFKKGKYVDATFNDNQAQARKMWRQAQKYDNEITEALYTYPGTPREELHKRLDHRIDTIEKIRSVAKDLFPDVSESFVVASVTLE